jgi:hypothetical protein
VLEWDEMGLCRFVEIVSGGTDEISCSMRGMRACIEWFLVEKTGEWAKAASSHQYIYI